MECAAAAVGLGPGPGLGLGLGLGLLSGSTTNRLHHHLQCHVAAAAVEGRGSSEVVTCRMTPMSSEQRSTVRPFSARQGAGPIACLMGRESERSKTHVTIRESGVKSGGPPVEKTFADRRLTSVEQSL